MLQVLPQPSDVHWLLFAQTGTQTFGFPVPVPRWHEPGTAPPLQSLSVVHGFRHQIDFWSSACAVEQPGAHDCLASVNFPQGAHETVPPLVPLAASGVVVPASTTLSPHSAKHCSAAVHVDAPDAQVALSVLQCD